MAGQNERPAMSQTIDRVILNGRAITFDDRAPRAEALAIAGDKIVAVGGTADIRALAGPGTVVFDAQGGTILPGFIDSHVHLFGGSAELEYLNLYGIQGIDPLTQAVREESARRPDDTVVFAVSAAYDILGPGRQTTRQDLDAVLPDRPFAMFAADHHTIWANTKALELGGILHGGQTDSASRITMAPDGTATGELLEPGAYGYVLRHTRFGGRDLEGMTTGRDPDPLPGPAERARDKAVIAAGLRHCASHGITGLHNMDGNIYTAQMLSDLDGEGALLCRTEVPFHLKGYDPVDRLQEAVEMRAMFDSPRLWSRRVKMFLDGVTESRTAWMLRPYPGDTRDGDPVFAEEGFAAACRAADALGFQLATHAIGDRAIRTTLDAYAAAMAANGPRDRRHRIEHVEVLHPDDLPRFAELGVVASMQPGHTPFGRIYTPDGMEKHLHPDQIAGTFALRAIRDSGARLTFSTDWPVIQVDVMDSLRAATAPIAMPAGWGDQTQTLMEALHSYTQENAWLEFAEDRRGTLCAGFDADIVVMDHDLEALAPVDLPQARAALTIMGGQVTWQA